MDDDFPTTSSSGHALETSMSKSSPLGLDGDAGGQETTDGFAKFAGTEGRDEIALYREAMRAKDRRMKGLPADETIG